MAEPQTEADLESGTSLGGSKVEDERSPEEEVILESSEESDAIDETGPGARKSSLRFRRPKLRRSDGKEIVSNDVANATNNEELLIDRRKITLAGTKIFERKTHFSLCKHKLAAIHLSTRHFWCFKLPIATITLVSGILAFLATTTIFEDRDEVQAKTIMNATSTYTNSTLNQDQPRRILNEEEAKTILNTIVGSLAFVLAFMQTMASHFKLDTRAEMHKGTEVDLADLREYLDVAVDRAKVLEEHGFVGIGIFKDEDGNGIDDVVENVFDSYQSRYSQCLTGCKSTVPLRINDAFNNLESKLQVIFSLSKHKKSLRSVYGPDYESAICFQACDILAAKFSGSWRWPLFTPPDPIWAVEQTIDDLEYHLPEDVKASILIKKPKKKKQNLFTRLFPSHQEEPSK